MYNKLKCRWIISSQESWEYKVEHSGFSLLCVSNLVHLRAPVSLTRTDTKTMLLQLTMTWSVSKITSLFLFLRLEVHYLKHHPLYEFRNLEEFHVDNYRHWLHQRVDYWNTETYPAQISPWEMGSKWGHFFFLIFPLFSMYYFGNQYKDHLKQKNQKNTIVGVFSQDSNWVGCFKHAHKVTLSHNLMIQTYLSI